MTLERGALLHKRYRIVEILGQGGMGSVYRAVDENLGVDVAVKENLFTTDEYARQFRLEAVILANLRHPNLPRVTDHFVIGDQGQYLVMDYIEGEDLRQRMERVGNITEDDAILIGAAICDALAYLHTRKPPILHRDLKPGNVKITPDGHIFLVDFGLAKVLHGSQATTTGARAMTPGYSPPEQYGTARTDPRTDIYSLGATLYAALSGIIPEDGLARAMENTQLTPLRKRNSKVPRRLASSIEKAMGIDPADRFQDAEEFKRALLGSQTKTPHLPGEYVVEPAPPDPEEVGRPNALERASAPIPERKSGKSKEVIAEAELPVFKPKRKKRKGRRALSFFLLVLFLLSLTMVAAVRFLPQFVPAQMMTVLSPLNEINLPFLPRPNTPTSLPAATQTLAPTDAPTDTLIAAAPTATATLSPTETPEPTLEITATADSTALPVVTPMGGGSGEIVFASSRAGVPQLYLSKIDGTDQVQITEMEQGACQPSWSPDGQQLVFISPCLGRGEFNDTIYNESSLYVVNADGTGVQALTSVPGSDFDPAWSPDGTQIAFTSVRDGFRQIYSLDVETQAITLLTNTDRSMESSQPAWSLDGKRIAYTVQRVGTYQVWAMDAATGQESVQLARSGQDLWDFLPVWSPDGTTIFFSQRRLGPFRPWLMKVIYQDLSQDPRKLDFPTPIEDLSFSPDGLWMVFEGMDGSGNRDIYYMTLAGSGRTRLTTDSKIDFDPAWRPSADQ
ncbi:MAG: serine/threonine-protein kinase [Chloroflexi bacterium]|nr:MAG: serine/threonine-protein kinase [Chloroflexota bacterium]